MTIASPLTRAGTILYLALLTGCAGAGSKPLTNPEVDPWENLNRSIYSINTTVDRYTLKPIAKGYRAVVPQPIRTGVSNFSNNLYTPASAVNNLLQGKPKRMVSDLSRFVVNTTIGLGGFIDIASASGLEEYNEDFGQTLATWGAPDGPFVILPFFGPYTLRDAIALPVNFWLDTLRQIDSSSIRDKLWALRFIDLRYRLLAAEGLLETSKDPYVTLRESYLQNRRFVIHDGNPPLEDDFYDDFEDLDDLEEFDDLEDFDDLDEFDDVDDGGVD